MKRKMILICLFLLAFSLMVTGSEDKVNELSKFNIELTVFPDTGTAWCDISARNVSHKFDETIIKINNIEFELAWEEAGLYSFHIFDHSELQLSAGDKVIIEIKHPDLPDIKEIFIVPACPDKLKADHDIMDYFLGDEDIITLSWNDIGCEEYCIVMETWSESDNDIYVNTSYRYVSGDSSIYTREDLERIYRNNKESIGKLIFELYGTSSWNKSTTYGNISIKVNSSEKASLTAFINEK